MEEENNNNKERNVGKISKNILIGTAGYSYKDWEGIFYPEGVKKGGEKIKHYLNYFSTVEIDSSYYRILDPGYLWFLVKNTPQNFFINMKIHQNITHKHEKFQETADQFRKSVEPLQTTERDFLVLFQFPYSFKFNQKNLDYLQKINREFDFKKAIEFRHFSWDDERVYKFLEENSLPLVNVDVPRIKGLFPSYITKATDPIAYLRLHGRNAKKWWKHDKAYERYNYEYSENEIEKSIVKRIEQLLKTANKLIVIFNNHYQAKAVRNAQRLISFLE